MAVSRAKTSKPGRPSKASKAKVSAKTPKASKTTTAEKAKKVVAPKAVKPVKEAFTKTQLFTYISERSGVSRKEVSSVMDALSDAIKAHLAPRAIGEFSLFGLMKLVRIRKPAKKARKGINPFTGEETVFKAKPAKNVLKARFLKKLKDMIN